MYHTGTGPTSATGGNTGATCDDHVSEVQSERTIFTLNTAIMAVGEGNYGRLGDDQQRHYTDANAGPATRLPDEQPGAMPEIAPSPDYGRSIEQAVQRAGDGPAGVGRLRHDLAGRPPAARRPSRHGARTS